MIFNEQVMYKDRSTVVLNVTEIDQKKYKFVNLDELTESTVQKRGEENKENVDSQVDQCTPVVEVRRSSRTISSHGSQTPKEVWSSKEVKFSYLKVFSCVSYVHIDSDARSKLDAKSKICFFIGYGDEKFGYRF